MTSKKRPNVPHKDAPAADPLAGSMNAGLGDLVGGLVGGILEQVKQLAGWVGHPLAQPLDTAEAQLTKGATGGSVSSAEMAKGLEVQTRGLTGATVHVVGSDTSSGVNVGQGADCVWVVLVGDEERLDHAFQALRTEISEENTKYPACHDVVFWTRKWDATEWSKAFGAGLGPLAAKPLWAKLWDANGTLVGPVARAPPALVPMGDLKLDLSGGA
ncbi:MAG: hypothetical protein KGJ23_07410 [Euryarchaeota archaeon]|nr:hypothetical protein [Euryarchaeota archaeon]MDE1836426.1 hypothetical protein [Euryarchaeota archaeon]MDE1879059.1 hypothetical protein [Euryarchaeota archaeon]MDE2044174.1 hypothetical protein [Thermoplasmata archaeon]